MRAVRFLVPAMAMLFATAAFGQASPPFYINKDARFAIIFPAEPRANDVSYTTASGAAIPARQFSAIEDGNLHAITVVVFPTGPAVDNAAVDYAANELRKRGEVRFQAAEDYDPGLPGRQLNIFEPDGRQLRASVYMWDHRLYITEAEGAPGAISLFRFEQSVVLLDENGDEINLDAARFEGRGR